MQIPAEVSRKLIWRKSTLSQGASNCVELAPMPGGEVAMRNSRDPEGAVLVFTRAEMAVFVEGAKLREFDDLS